MSQLTSFEGVILFQINQNKNQRPDKSIQAQQLGQELFRDIMIWIIM